MFKYVVYIRGTHKYKTIAICSIILTLNIHTEQSPYNVCSHTVFFCFIVQAEKMVLSVEDCVQFKEEVQMTLDDLIQGQKEAQAEVTKILDCPTVREAQQLLLIHQVLLDIHLT